MKRATRVKNTNFFIYVLFRFIELVKLIENEILKSNCCSYYFTGIPEAWDTVMDEILISFFR